MHTGLGSTPLHGKPPGRRERKKLDTRRRIFRAALDLFKEKGFDDTTVEEIAELADVGKGTVFNYFPQKTDFLLAAYREWVVVIREDLGPVESWTEPARTQLLRVFNYLAALGEEHRPFARQVLLENMRQAHLRMAQDDPRTDQGLPGEWADLVPGEDDVAVRLLEDITREVIRRGKENAEVRPGIDEGPVASIIAATAFHTLVRGLVQGVSAGDMAADLEKKMDIIFTGIAL
jgi:AcrR family transcriptional regulator